MSITEKPVLVKLLTDKPSTDVAQKENTDDGLRFHQDICSSDPSIRIWRIIDDNVEVMSVLETQRGAMYPVELLCFDFNEEYKSYDDVQKFYRKYRFFVPHNDKELKELFKFEKRSVLEAGLLKSFVNPMYGLFLVEW